MGKARFLLLLAIPLIFTAVVYYPITRSYFFADDFLNLYYIVNVDLPEYLLTPHGGHILLARNALFWLCFQAFGTEPAGYFWIALLTHLLNVLLLFLVVSRFTGSPRLACFGATLWGVSPLHEGTLGWYAVYGQAFAVTTMLPILLGAARLRAENRPPSRRILVFWYMLALIGCMSFGVGIGVALVLPFVLALLLPRPAGRPGWRLPLLSLLLVVPLLYVGMHQLYTALSGSAMLTGKVVEVYVLHWEAVFPMLVHLCLDGVTELSLGFLHEPQWSARWLSLALFGLWTFGVVRLLQRGSPSEREEVLAFLMLALGCYGIVAVGRASLYESASPFGVGVRIAASAPRYHHAALVPLTLILCLLLRQMRPSGSSGTKVSLVALIAWLLLALGSWATTPEWIDHHDASRGETSEVLAAIRVRVRAAKEGSEVRIANHRFQEVGPLVPKTLFPGWAAIFTISFPDDTLDGKRIRFVEKNPEVIEAARRGRRISKILIPAPGPRRDPPKKPGLNWFERKMDQLNRLPP